MLPTSITVPPIIPISFTVSVHIVIASVKARHLRAMDELSNIAPRFVELTVTLWAQTHWDDRQAYARQTVKWTKAAEKDSY